MLDPLPRWRGAAPVEHALLNGDQQTGITIFKLIEEMDAGPIISQFKIDINQQISQCREQILALDSVFDVEDFKSFLSTLLSCAFSNAAPSISPNEAPESKDP